MEKWDLDGKFFLTENFLRIALKSISSDLEPKQNSDPDFDFSKKVGISMKNFGRSKIQPKLL